jgi:small-conductance mechanosensitive channel
MKELFHDISEIRVLEFLLICILLFIGLRIIQKGLTVYMSRKQVNPIFNRFFPIVEFAVWIMFLIWGAKQIFQTGIAGSILLLMLMVGILTWAGGFVIRDWITGVVFKAEDRYRVGDIVSFQNTRGRLTNLGYRSLVIETADGRTIEIPYNALVRESAIEKIPGEAACAKFQLSVPAQEPFPEVRQEIQTITLCAPWSSIARKSHVRLIEREETHCTVEVTAFLIDQAYAPEVEMYVRQHFNRKI